IERIESGYLFREGSDSVLVYRHEVARPGHAHARSHYVHPLYSLSGVRLTEDFPADHPHQHGIFGHGTRWMWTVAASATPGFRMESIGTSVRSRCWTISPRPPCARSWSGHPPITWMMQAAPCLLSKRRPPFRFMLPRRDLDRKSVV